jgi:hypothetical protein
MTPKNTDSYSQFQETRRWPLPSNMSCFLILIAVSFNEDDTWKGRRGIIEKRVNFNLEEKEEIT